jgi:hypothetical protein
VLSKQVVQLQIHAPNPISVAITKPKVFSQNLYFYAVVPYPPMKRITAFRTALGQTSSVGRVKAVERGRTV